MDPAPTTIVVNEPFRTGFVIVNDGDATTYTRVVFDLPTDVLLAEPPQDCVGRFDPVERRVVFEGSVPAGWTGRCTLSLIAIPGRSTHASLAVRVETPPDRFAGDVKEAVIETPPAPAAVRVGGIGITAAGLAVLVWLAVLVISVVIAKTTTRLAGPAVGGSAMGRATRGRGPVHGAIAIVVALGFLSYFAWMAWDDWRVLTAFQTTTCDVVDATISANTRNESRGSTRTASTTYMPNFSLRYRTDAGLMTAIGFATPSRLQYDQAEVVEFIDALQARRAVPCRYDPENPTRVVLLAGFGGAYLFALAPLLLIAFGLVLLRSGRVYRPST